MSQQMQINMVDDLTGESTAQGADVQTRLFALSGVSYEIDLTDKNFTDLQEALSPFVGAARPMRSARRGGGMAGKRSTPAASSGRSSSTHVDYDSKAVRAWAASNGVTTPARGRIPNAVLEQYRSANA